jgi:segregation and condensation protein A
MSFEIHLPLFEGPFDLLLFFIERDEINIYDIPIAQITEDFLNYLHQLEQMNIEVASEFILVAATLMKIKARLLLPKEENKTDTEDPRQELVNYLLEYKKYQSVLEVFAEMESIELQKEKRGNIAEDVASIAKAHALDLELHKLDMYKLLKVYENVLNRYEERQNQPIHTIVPYPYTVAGQKDYLLQTLQNKQRLSFQVLIAQQPAKIAVIFNFLAILELLQLNQIEIQLGSGYNDFWIQEADSEGQYNQPLTSP